MKIYFTGASSFTGYWFCKALADAGHQVVAAFTKPNPHSYSEPYRTRCDLLMPLVDPIWNAAMGSRPMMDRLAIGDFDLLCLHGAVVGNHRTADFPVLKALHANVVNLKEILTVTQHNGLKAVVHTGTYYEADEGRGTEPLRAFSPYALSKTLTWQYVSFNCWQQGVNLGKFVVANPFGPLERPGFTQYLLTSWRNGSIPIVNTPDYVRDYVPVDLMALHYTDFCCHMASNRVAIMAGQAVPRCCPTLYAGRQGDFARRFASEFSKAFSIPCEVEFAVQSDFAEPKERVSGVNCPGMPSGTDSATSSWDENRFWSDYLRRR